MPGPTVVYEAARLGTLSSVSRAAHSESDSGSRPQCRHWDAFLVGDPPAPATQLEDLRDPHDTGTPRRLHRLDGQQALPHEEAA